MLGLRTDTLLAGLGLRARTAGVKLPSVAASADDAALVERVLTGEHSAFRTLVERYQQRLHRIVYRLVGNQDDAAEITQQAFLAAFSALGTYLPRYPFSPWLVRIGVNLSKDHLKAARSREITVSPETFDSHLSAADSPEQVAVRREESAALSAALATLADADREILVLKDVEQLSFDEIAVVLKRPKTALKIRAFRARGRLRKALERIETTRACG